MTLVSEEQRDDSLLLLPRLPLLSESRRRVYQCRDARSFLRDYSSTIPSDRCSSRHFFLLPLLSEQTHRQFQAFSRATPLLLLFVLPLPPPFSLLPRRRLLATTSSLPLPSKEEFVYLPSPRLLRSSLQTRSSRTDDDHDFAFPPPLPQLPPNLPPPPPLPPLPSPVPVALPPLPLPPEDARTSLSVPSTTPRNPRHRTRFVSLPLSSSYSPRRRRIQSTPARTRSPRVSAPTLRKKKKTPSPSRSPSSSSLSSRHFR